MKRRNKGKIHSSSSSSPRSKDAFSVLKLMPAAILALVSLLTHEEREVLAYMISRALKSTTNPSPASFPKKSSSNNGKKCFYKSPALFDCDCFHCYTSFWCRWDSSSNRELIHQAIEAFEDHLNNGEQLKNSSRVGRRRTRRAADGAVGSRPAVEPPGIQENPVAVVPECGGKGIVAAAAAEVVRSNKGLARKVLPDFIGIFNSRLWSLWSPNV